MLAHNRQEGSMGDPEDLVDIGDPVLFCQLPEECAELNAFVQTTQPSSSPHGLTGLGRGKVCCLQK